jgi:hypothetical protein
MVSAAQHAGEWGQAAQLQHCVQSAAAAIAGPAQVWYLWLSCFPDPPNVLICTARTQHAWLLSSQHLLLLLPCYTRPTIAH